jgi:WD40 repeat protein
MSEISSQPTPHDLTAIRYPSLAAIEAAHSELLKRQREEGDAPAFLAAVLDFLGSGPATGALLDADPDRRSAQSIFDYWAAKLYRVGQEPPDGMLAEFDPHIVPALPDALCPYLGLDAFREDDHDKFFGRRELIAKLIERLATNRLLAVVGPSGSGKSSLVRAGLIPALKAGALPGSQHWRYLPPLVPGSDPLAALRRVLPDNPTARHAQAQAEPDLRGSVPPCVLVVDQFEELFTLCEDVVARETFIGALLALATEAGGQSRVILTMRSDFETFIARVPALQPLFEQGRIQVTPLSAGELREAITQPAAAVGLKFEAGVIEALLQEILGEPAALPLLQFTLLKLWENRERNRVTQAAYLKVGGGRLALARSADAFFAALIPEEQTTARRILLRMVRPGDGLEITSSRIRRDDLYQGGEDPGRVERVLAKLVAARLVRLTAGETPGDDQVEVAHEALVRNWPTLVDWLEEEKVAIATRRRLEGRAAGWVRLGKGSSGLLDEVELRAAERWLASSEAAYLGYDPALPELVAASGAAIAAAKLRETTQQVELATARAVAQAERRASRQLRWLVGVLFVLLLVATLATIYAFQQQVLAQQAVSERTEALVEREQQRNIAQQAAADRLAALAQTQAQLTIADSQRLAFASQIQLDEAPEAALLLAYEAVARDQNAQSEQALRAALDRAPGNVIPLIGHKGPVSDAQFTPDGQQILTIAGDATARLWNRSGKLLTTFAGHTGALTSAHFSQDGRELLTSAADGTTRLWTIAGQQIAQFAGVDGQLSPNGQLVLTRVDETWNLWDRSGKALASLRGHTGKVFSALFSPDSQRVLTGSTDGTARLWDLAGNELVRFQGHTQYLTSAVFSPDGQLVLTGAADGTARLWDMTGQTLKTLDGGGGLVAGAVFSPDGQHILTITHIGIKKLWDLSGAAQALLEPADSVFSTAGQTFLKTFQHGPPTAWSMLGLVISPDAQIVVTHTRNNTLQLNTAAGQAAGIFSEADRVTFNADGQYAVTVSNNGIPRLWDMRGQPLGTFRGVVAEPVYSPDGRQLLTVYDGGLVRMADLDSGDTTAWRTGDDAVSSAIFSPDGKYVLTVAYYASSVQVWDGAGKRLAGFKGFHAHFSPNGRQVVGLSGAAAELWNLDGTKAAELTNSAGGSMFDATFSPDGQYILILNDYLHANAWLWKVAAGTATTLSLANGPQNGASFSPDSKQIVWTIGDGTVRLMELDGREDWQRPGSGIGFSPDGTRILTFEGTTVHLLDRAGREVAALPSAQGGFSSALLSPDGTRIVTRASDQIVRVWDLNGVALAALRDYSSDSAYTMISPDGRRVLSWSRAGIVRQYAVPLDALLPIAACRAGRGLTDAEIKQFDVGTPHFDLAKRQCPTTLGP